MECVHFHYSFVPSRCSTLSFLLCHPQSTLWLIKKGHFFFAHNFDLCQPIFVIFGQRRSQHFCFGGLKPRSISPSLSPSPTPSLAIILLLFPSSSLFFSHPFPLGPDGCGPADDYSRIKTMASRTHATQWFFGIFLLCITARKGTTHALINFI